MPEPADLEQQLAELSTYRAPAGWQDSVRAAIAAGEPPRAEPVASQRLWWGVGAALAIAAGVAIYLAIGRTLNPLIVEPGPGSAPVIALDVRHAQGSDHAMGAASVGDAIVVRARGARELRVYRDGEEIAHCPGEAACRQVGGALELVVEIRRSGAIVAIAYAAGIVAPAAGQRPSTADLDLDLGAAAHAQIKMTMSAPIEVR